MRRVFELNRNFRNEGADATHNPEFTCSRPTRPYGDYDTMRDADPGAVLEAPPRCRRPIAHRRRPDGDGVEFDLPRRGTRSPCTRRCRRPVGDADHAGHRRWTCCASAAAARGELRPGRERGQAGAGAVRGAGREQTRCPDVLRDFPVETSPLTRRAPRRSAAGREVGPLVFGIELGTAYSELIDPIDQRAAAHRAVAAGGRRRPRGDGDRRGLPARAGVRDAPTGGLGLGVDRLVMTADRGDIRADARLPVRPPRALGPGDVGLSGGVDGLRRQGGRSRSGRRHRRGPPPTADRLLPRPGGARAGDRPSPAPPWSSAGSARQPGSKTFSRADGATPGPCHDEHLDPAAHRRP